MSRPTSLLKDATLYWVIRLYDSSNELVDADSTPTVAVRKNGSSVGDSVTVTKRSATTGIYDCSYNPASEIEGDQFTFEESVTISSTSYSHSWALRVFDPERGTDSAYTGTPPTIEEIAGEVWSNVTRSLTDKSGFGLSSAAIAAIEASLVDEGDSTALLQAIADKIAGDLTAGDLSALAIVSAIKADATLAQMIARIDASITSRLASGSYTAPLDAGGIRDAVGLASANLDTQLSTIDSVVDAIVIDTAEIGAAGAGLTAVPWNAAWDAEVQSEVADALAVYDPPTKAELDSGLAALNDLSTADIDARLAAYDGPTNTEMTAAFAEIKGAGWSEATDTLENIRDTSGGGSSSDSVLVLVSTTIDTLTSQTVFTLTAGSSDNNAYRNAIAIITDQSTATQKAFVPVSNYTGSTKTITLDKTPAFSLSPGDSVSIVVTSGSITPSQIAASITVAPIQFNINNTKVAKHTIKFSVGDIAIVGPILVTANGSSFDLSGFDTVEVYFKGKSGTELHRTSVTVGGDGNNSITFLTGGTLTDSQDNGSWYLYLESEDQTLTLNVGEFYVDPV